MFWDFGLPNSLLILPSTHYLQVIFELALSLLHGSTTAHCLSFFLSIYARSYWMVSYSKVIIFTISLSAMHADFTKLFSSNGPKIAKEFYTVLLYFFDKLSN